ncbi:hypothetical protein Dsin_001997 [Dipteronia sinensis]|uniref:Reverse transcriptase zinc-binding domain-containing protein n=1 Tax=Dipteronia sinensis TaxID=43782 RepID=A0AAE0B5F3_9ROSI|nr:hypothetical protein Dsin_001997 [Dipteronia sinensis]
MWGREIVIAGSRWLIGDGSSVCIYSDSWLPRPTTFKVYSSVMLNPGAKVESLKLANGGCNEGIVRESFSSKEASLISSIPCSSRTLPDKLMCHFEKFGCYSVKSGHHMAMFLSFNPSSSGLAMRGVDVSPSCSVCKRWPETTVHALWSCPALKEIWAQCGLLNGASVEGSNLLDFMISCMKGLLLADMELMCMIIWKFWFRRNCLVGIGIIIRDNLGEVLASSAQPVGAQFTLAVAVALAVFRGLLFARDYPGCSVAFTSRMNNLAAHGLAKIGLSMSCDMFWMEEVPPNVVLCVLGDRPGSL